MTQTTIASPDHIRLFADVSRMAELGEWLRARCGVYGIPEQRTGSLELAVHEVAVNIIRHAYVETNDGWIDVHLAIDDRGLVVVLEDVGEPYDPRSSVEPDLSVPHEGGYGLYLVRELVDHVEYQRTSIGNRWELRLDSGRSN